MFSSSLAASATLALATGTTCVERGPIERGRRLGGLRVDATHHLGDGARGERRVARVFPFRREGHQHVAGRLQAAGEEAGQQLLFRGARVGGRLQDDQLTRAQVRGHLVGGVADEGEVGLAMPPQRRGHADDDGIAAGQPVEVRGGGEAAAGHGLAPRAPARCA